MKSIEEDQDGTWWIRDVPGEGDIGPFGEADDASLWLRGMVEGDPKAKEICKLNWEIDDE